MRFLKKQRQGKIRKKHKVRIKGLEVNHGARKAPEKRHFPETAVFLLI